MNSQSMCAHMLAGDGKTIEHIRGWMIVAGAMSIGLGAAAVSHGVTATRVSVALLGWLLMLSGLVHIVHAVLVRSWSGFFLYLLDGIVRATVGALVVMFPNSGALALTLLLSFFFIVAGLSKSIGSIALQFPGWGWSVASGLISVALGLMLALQWPVSRLWFIGFAVGVDLIVYGWALLMLAAAVRTQSRPFA